MPKEVSGRVVKIGIVRSGRPATGSANSAPSLRPAGQPVAPIEQLLGVVGDLEEPAVDLADRHLRIAAPAAARLDLLVGEHGLAGRAPVHARPPPVGEAALEHPDEDELLPLVVGGIAGGHLAVPVVGDAHALELRAHVVDVLVGPHRRMHPVLDRRVLGGQPEGVPAHRVQHVEAPHPLVAGQQIADRVDPHVAHVNAAGRVRKHLEAVVLGPAGLLGHLELLAVRPGFLPPGLDLREGVAVLTVVEGHIGADFYTLRRGAQETAPEGLERPSGVRDEPYFFFRVRLIALAASSAFATDSACLPASWSALASLARATAFLDASSVLPAVASWTCLIRSGHWLASTGEAASATIARAIMSIFMRVTPFRCSPSTLNPPAARKLPPPGSGGRNHRSVGPASG